MAWVLHVPQWDHGSIGDAAERPTTTGTWTWCPGTRWFGLDGLGSRYRYLSSDSLPHGRKPHAARQGGVFFSVKG